MSNQSQQGSVRTYVAVVSFYLDGENKVNVGDEIEVAAGSKTTWGGVEVKYGNLRKALKAKWVVDAGTPEAEAAKQLADEDPEAAGNFPYLTRGNRDASTLEESDIEVASVPARAGSIRATDGHGVITDAARKGSPAMSKTAGSKTATQNPARTVGTSINQGQRPPKSSAPAPRPVAAQRTAAVAGRAAEERARADRTSRVTVGSSDGGTVGRAKTPLSHDTLLLT